ncbi:DEBR0S4_06260g1_1 [Brettanomyces bruxellensis]|uniref:non-specific serine/threonine protein kinase n=1 Tax=Dekkera bruxellensis TaxID=5007 RepID=A0A7D9CYN1_DEKBR|nr:DEBR0S4_06260g1_1 [Brettanomyces bruxellensis]
MSYNEHNSEIPEQTIKPTSGDLHISGDSDKLIVSKVANSDDISKNEKKHVEATPIPLRIPKIRRPGSQDRAGGAKSLHSSQPEPIILPKPRQRVLCEFTNTAISPVLGKRNFRIGPVDRIASRPMKPPLLEEERLEFHHAEESSRPVGTAGISVFVTYEPKTNRRQVWKCRRREIGEGSFSKVYVTVDRKNAIKVVRVDPDEDDDTRLRVQGSLLRELEILQEISHPNIVKLFGYNSDLKHNHVTMAMSFYRGGDMFDMVLKHRLSLHENVVRAIFSNVASAVRYLHHHDICHRDIKLENVLLIYGISDIDLWTNNVPDRVAVLSDFGLSKKISKDDPLLTTRCGSEDYVSPELLLGLKYDGKQNDCWALGVLLYSILEGLLPFDSPPNSHRSGRSSRPSHRISTITWSWYQLQDNGKDSQGNDFSQAKEIVDHLLVKRTKRWTIDQICDHQWLSSS